MDHVRRVSGRAVARVAVIVGALSGVGACGGAAAGAAGAGGATPQAALANYAGTLYGCVMERFSVHASRFSGMRAHVQIRVAPDGTVGEPVVTRPSADPEYDAAIVAAAEACRQLPPPPPEIASKLEGDGLQIVFETP